MAEDLRIIEGSREDQYSSLIPQIRALIAEEEDLIANMANSCAALKEQFNFFWVGFYLVKAEELVVGPFQGPVACSRISFGKGVCGLAWKTRQTIIVPNVDLFPGHIACNELSKSEIVIPLIFENVLLGVLDIDSKDFDYFTLTDKKYLEELASLIVARSY